MLFPEPPSTIKEYNKKGGVPTASSTHETRTNQTREHVP